MKSIFLPVLIIGVLAGPVGAECFYFRVSAKLLTCVPVDPKTVHESTNSYQEPGDLPELADPNSPSMVQATCECAYSLKGSDMRCDMDQTIEKSSFMGTENTAASCRRGP